MLELIGISLVLGAFIGSLMTYLLMEHHAERKRLKMRGPGRHAFQPNYGPSARGYLQ